MPKASGGYRQVLIQTFMGDVGNMRERVRAHALPGQGLDPRVFVACSHEMREKYLPGTIFKITASITHRYHGTHFLYTHYSWPWEKLSPAQARAFIRGLTKRGRMS